MGFYFVNIPYAIIDKILKFVLRYTRSAKISLLDELLI
jgi:hypothetical protein